MELGATICSPKQPSCSSCPVADHCRALDLVKKFELSSKGKLTNAKIKKEKDIEDCCIGKNMMFFCRGAVAQSVEWSSKVSVYCNSADVGSNHAAV